MGNYFSCTIIPVSSPKFKGAKVILPNGDIRQFDSSMRVGELLFDMPDYFLVNTKTLKLGKMFTPLHDCDELKMNNIYTMFETARMDTFVTTNDMGRLLVKTRRAESHASSRASSHAPSRASSYGPTRVTPVKNLPRRASSGSIQVPSELLSVKHPPRSLTPDFTSSGRVRRQAKHSPRSSVSEPGFNMSEVEEISAAEFKHRLSLSRLRKPALETIIE